MKKHLLKLKTTFFTVAVVGLIFGSAHAQSIKGGKTEKGNGGYYPWENGAATKRGLTFDAHCDFVLKSVKVYNGESSEGSYSGPRTFTVIDTAGNIVDSATVNVVEGEQRLMLNLNIPAGTRYKLLSDVHKGLWRDGIDSFNYPYDIGGICSITGYTDSTGSRSGTNYYYFFYDWEIESKIAKGAKTERDSIGGYYPWECTGGACKRGLTFDAASDFILKSVKVYNGILPEEAYTGNRTFTVIDLSGNIIAETTVYVDTGEQRLNLNMSIPAGTGYKLLSDVHKGLWRDSEGPFNYPYDVGGICSITGYSDSTGTRSGTNYYYFFYDWEIEAVSEYVTLTHIKGGKTDNAGSYYPLEKEIGLAFDASSDFILKSVKVYNGVSSQGSYSGPRTFMVIDTSGNIIDSTTVEVVEGEQRLDLNLNIPAGSDYRLLSDLHVGLWRDNYAEYPYDIGGLGAITGWADSEGGMGKDKYYFFYDWEIDTVTTDVIAITKENGFNIYPNPVRNQLIIDINDRADFSVYNTTGQLIIRKELTDFRNIINVQSWENGIYIYEIILKNNTKSRKIGKIIKQ